MDNLIVKYTDLAIKHGEYILAGDSKKANKIHKQLMEVIPEIQNDKSLHESFFELLDHNNISVRIWTAVELSNTFRERAISILRDIEKLDNIFSLTAIATIDIITTGMISMENWNNE